VELLSTSEAADRLGVHERTLRRYIARSQIDCRRLPGGHYRIALDAIEEFWAACDRPRRSRPLKGPPRAGEHPSPQRRPDSVPAPERSYDLSREHLAKLRAALAHGPGGGPRNG
jgi:excisionase family DNA binding protein